MAMRSLAAGAAACVGTAPAAPEVEDEAVGTPLVAPVVAGAFAAAVGLPEGKNVGLLPLKTCHWSHNNTSEKPNITQRMVRRISSMFMAKTSCRETDQRTVTWLGRMGACLWWELGRVRRRRRAGSEQDASK